MLELSLSSPYLIHRKKRFSNFPSPAGMSLTKLPLGRNNSIMTSLFPPRESLVVTSWLGTGNSRTFFYGVTLKSSSRIHRSCTGVKAGFNSRTGCMNSATAFQPNYKSERGGVEKVSPLVGHIC
jgi:hypothetical protein